MEHFKTLFVILCLRCLEFAVGSSFRSDSSSYLARQQQFQLIAAGAAKHRLENAEGSATVVPAGVVSDQPHRLEKTAQASPKKVALLSIVQDMQSDHVKKQAELSATLPNQVNLREKQLLSNMGRLEQQLESWERGEEEMDEQATVATPSARPIEHAGKDDVVGVMAWRNRNALTGLALSMGISICFFGVVLRSRSRPKQEVPPRLKQAVKDSVEPQAVVKEPMSPEVSKQLADLARMIEKVRMPSEDSLQVAMQVMESSEPENSSAAKESAATTTEAATESF